MGRITYYNLDSHYEGDVSMSGKCGVSVKDIDKNFYNLKSEDVKNVYWDEKESSLNFVLYDGTKLTVSDINPYHLHLDKDTETLFGKTVEGDDFAISLHAITDATIEGEGSYAAPLSIAKSYRSGAYEPVIKIIDNIDDAICKEGNKYLLKSIKSNIGRLYTKEEVSLIEEALSGSSWHVATKDEWNAMLNGVEICDPYRTHAESLINRGQFAGQFLKSDRAWDGDNLYGFNVLPIKDENEAVYLTGDETKAFKTEESDIFCSEDTSGRYFIRLVKRGAYSESENILGQDYLCVKMPAWDKDFIEPNVWMAQNLNLSELNGEVIGETTVEEKILVSYTIIQWDGNANEWKSFPLKEGYSTYVISEGAAFTLTFENGDYKLVSSKEYIDEQISVVKALIIASGAISEQGIEALTKFYKKLIDDMKAGDDKLQKNIDTLDAKVDQVKEELENEISALKLVIDEEIGESIEEIRLHIDEINEELSDKIENLEENGVEDVIFDKDDNYVKLKLNNGLYTTGFNASDFIAKGIIEDVYVSGSCLIFIFAGEVEPQVIDLKDIFPNVKGEVADVQVNGVSVLDKTTGIAYIEDIPAVSEEDITIGNEDIPAGTKLDTIIEKVVAKNANTEKAVAGALNYLFELIIKEHPELLNK